MICVQNALKSAHDRSIAEHLTASDRALLWLSYIHLTEFDRLPSSLYDSSESGPSRLVCRESFLLPWKTQQDISTPPDILIALFQGTEPNNTTAPFHVSQCCFCSEDTEVPFLCPPPPLSDAAHQCSDESASPSERTLACLPLHTNLIFLNKLLER